MTKEQEKQITAFMNLGYTREEAIAEIMDDDLGGTETEEVKELAKKAKQAGRQNAGKSGRSSTPKERKPNEDKRTLVSMIAQAIPDSTISNIERQVDFVYNGVNYSITLTAHRPPKEAKS